MPKKVEPAPRGGWSQNASLLEPLPYTAEILDNFFPTAEGVQLRGGSVLHATVSASVVKLLTYAAGSTQKLFAADATSIYEITSPSDATVAPTADVSSLTSGDWVGINFGTSGGNFLFIANGADSIRHYNGTTWATPSITGVSSSDLSFVWEYGERIWAVEGGTLSAWYLEPNSIAGAATELPLDGVFTFGGSLLFGASWSIDDSGDGLSDLNVFVTTEGEVAVYSGFDPASATKVGTYRISRPLSKHAFFKAGGDVAIATEDGIISLAAAVQSDRSALSRNAITFPIEDAWRRVVTQRTASHTFNSTMWHSQTLLLVSVPDAYRGENQSFVANARTGAWCRFTGWDVQTSIVHDDKLFFGAADGKIYQGGTSGSDNGTVYSGYWLPKFMRADGSQIELNMARVTFRGNFDLSPEMTGAADYSATYPSIPAVPVDTATDVWGTAIWGTDVWGSESDQEVFQKWESIDGLGQSTSVWVAGSSGRDTTPIIDLISLEYQWEQGFSV